MPPPLAATCPSRTPHARPPLVLPAPQPCRKDTTVADVARSATIRVAAIATDADVSGLPLPSRDATYSRDRALLERTRAAARGDAVLAVWPEAATPVCPDEESAWVEAVRTVARESDIDVVAAYVVPTSTRPLAYRNEYRLVLRDGAVQRTYAKHHPALGEPSNAGVGPASIVPRSGTALGRHLLR